MIVCFMLSWILFAHGILKSSGLFVNISYVSGNNEILEMGSSEVELADTLKEAVSSAPAIEAKNWRKLN